MQFAYLLIFIVKEINMKKVKIFIATHKKAKFPNNKINIIYHYVHIFQREMYFFAKNLFFGLDKLKKCATLIRVTKLLRRGCRAVRQRSAKSRTPVRFRSTPPFFLPSIIFHQVHFRNMSVLLLFFPAPLYTGSIPVHVSFFLP